MREDPKIFLEHILESIGESVTIQDAVIRRLEMKNLPSSFKNKHQEIPWKKIAGLRDILIHQYFGVDLDLVWEIVNKDIPKLKKQS